MKLTLTSYWYSLQLVLAWHNVRRKALTGNDPEKVSNGQRTNQREMWPGRKCWEGYTDRTICTLGPATLVPTMCHRKLLQLLPPRWHSATLDTSFSLWWLKYMQLAHSHPKAGRHSILIPRWPGSEAVWYIQLVNGMNYVYSGRRWHLGPSCIPNVITLDKISQVFPLCIYTLQVIKYWREWPGNEAIRDAWTCPDINKMWSWIKFLATSWLTNSHRSHNRNPKAAL